MKRKVGGWSIPSMLVVVAVACGQRDKTTTEALYESLTSVDRVLGFESVVADWTLAPGSSGTLSSDTDRTEGATSAKVSGLGWAQLQTTTLIGPIGPASNTATFDVKVLGSGTIPWGDVILQVESPTLGLNTQIGQKLFGGTQRGVFQTVSLPMSTSVVQKLSSSGYSDLQVRVITNLPGGSSVVIDHLSFGQPPGGSGGAGGAAGNAGAAGSAGGGASGTGGSGGLAGAGGDSGSSGMSGSSGTSGASGTSGTAGASGTAGSAGTAGTGGSAGVGDEIFIDLAVNLQPDEVVFGAYGDGGGLVINDGTRTVEASGGFSNVSSVLATIGTDFGVGTEVGNVFSGPDVFVRGSHIHGNLTTSGSLVPSPQLTSIIDGAITQGASLAPIQHIAWTAPFGTDLGAIEVPDGGSQTLSPGTYAGVIVGLDATLSFTGPGIYSIDGPFVMEPGSVLELANAAGQIEVYVREDFTFRGSIEKEAARANFLIGVLGDGDQPIERRFDAILVAPHGSIHLGTVNEGHLTSIFGKSILARPHTDITHAPFDPETFCEQPRCQGLCPMATGITQCQRGEPCDEDSDCVDGLSCHAGVCGGCIGPLDDMNACTLDECTMDDSVVHSPVPAGAICIPAGLPGVCDTIGNCNTPNVPGQPGEPCLAGGICSGDLVCGEDNGAHFGEASDADRCWHPWCELVSDQYCATTAALCGYCTWQPGYEVAFAQTCAPNCGGRTCGGATTHDGCGGGCFVCDPGQAGCVSDTDCGPGHACGQDNGSRFGLAAEADVCWPVQCEGDSASGLCGDTTSPCGECPSCEPDCSGKTCGPDGCGGDCGSCGGGEYCDSSQNCTATTAQPLGDLLASDNVDPIDYSTANGGATDGFASVSHDGQAQYAVPLTLPPGRNRLQPRLTLSYDSTAGSESTLMGGFMGPGWRLLGLSSIAVCPRTIAQDGVSEGVHVLPGTGTNAYCLDGLRLIAIDGEEGAAGSEYRTEVDTGVRITLESVADSRPATFKVYRKDGLVETFSVNRTGAAKWLWLLTRVEDRVGNYMTMQYDEGRQERAPGTHDSYEVLPTRIDYAGHDDRLPDTTIQFHYESRTALSGSVLPDVRARFFGGLLLRQTKFLTKISASVSGRLAREYRLNYQWMRNLEVSRMFVLDNLRECAPFMGDPAVTSCKSPTEFRYENAHDGSPSNPGLSSPHEIGDHPNDPGYALFDVIPDTVLDFDGDGADDLLMVVQDSRPPNSSNPNGWNKHLEVLLGGRTRVNTGVKDDFYNAPELYNVVDFDNDGADDVLIEKFSKPENYRVLTFKGGAFEVIDTGIASSWDHNGAGGVGRTYIVDADGDGVRDIVRCHGKVQGPYSWTLIRLPELTQRAIDFNHFCYPHYLAMDTDGSGAQQSLMIQHMPSGSSENSDEPFYVAVEFQNAERSASGNVTVSVTDTIVETRSRTGIAGTPLDANGDGLLDILVYKNGQLDTYLATGNRAEPYLKSPASFVTNSEHPGESTRLLDASGRAYGLGPALDVNGDGRDDVIVSLPGEFSKVIYATVASDGSADSVAFAGWELAPLLHPTASWGTVPKAPESAGGGSITQYVGRSQAMDLNGDGVKDFVQKDQHSLAPGTFVTNMRHGLDAPKLTSVKNGFGAEVQFEYTALSTVSPPDPSDPLVAFFPPSAGGGRQLGDTCVYPRRCATRRQTGVRIQRVFQGSFTDTDAAEVRTFRHEYGGGAFGLDGRGWLGYAHHTIFDTDQKVSAPDLLESFERFDFDTVTRDEASGLFPFLGIPTTYTQVTVIDNEQAPRRTFTRSSVPDVRHTTSSPRVLMPFVHEQNETEELESLASEPTLSTLSHTLDIDDFGNVKHIEWNWNSGAETETLDITYKHEEDATFRDRWLVALPRRIEQFSSGVVGESEQTDVTRTIEHDYYDSGLGETTTVEPGDPENEVETSFFPDEFGNLRTMEARAGGELRSTAVVYDARDVFPASIVDAEQYLTEYEFDAATGVNFRKVEYGSDASSTALTTLTVPDAFGRIRFVRQASGRETVIDYGGRLITVTSPGYGFSRTAFDELGREVSRQTPGLDGQQLFGSVQYDQFGRVASMRRPGLVLSGGSGITTHFTYDNLDRPLTELSQDGSLHETCYDGLVTCAKDRRGYVSCQEHDSKRRVVFSSDPLPDTAVSCSDAAASLRTSRSGFSGVTFRRGAFDSIEASTDSLGNETAVAYDKLGRPTRRSVPGGGVSTYAYTPFGDLETLTEAVGTDSERVISYEYDLIGRRRFRREGADETEWVWRSDFAGRLDHSTSPDGVTLTQDYDDSGRLQSITRSVDGSELVMSIEEYDASGRPTVISYPTADEPFLIENVYDEDSGTLREVRSAGAGPSVTYWTLEAISRLGQVAVESFGNGLVTTRGYHANTGLLATLETGPEGGTADVQRRSYLQDDSGNLEESEDEVRSRIDTFTYDHFERLDTVRRDGDLIQDYEYEELGQLETNAEGWSYDYEPAHPHAARSVTNGTDESIFTYDDFGRLEHRTAGVLPELNARYTSFHKLSRIWGDNEADAITFKYDSEQARVAKTSGTEHTEYFGKLYTRTSDSSTGDVKERFIVTNGMRPIAEVIRRDGSSTNEVFYLHDDILGSIDVVSDDDGDVAERRDYEPFGRGGADEDSDFTDLGFTLHRHEAELGLIDMGGRVYDPRVGQFLEPDPLVTFAANTQEANPYAYALNNPLRYTDPSGFVPCDSSSGCGEGIQIGPFILGGLPPTAPGSEPPPGQAFNTFAPFLPGLSEYSSFGAFAQRGPGPSRPTPAHLKNLSEAGLRFIAELEAFFPFPTDDGYGNITIGYGYVPRPGEDFSGGMTRAQGMVLLRQKIRIHEDAVRKAITRPLSQRQFDALVSFSYNAGSAGLTESGVAAAVNAGNFDAAVTAMFTRVRAGRPAKISLGLVHRRVLEAELMLRGDYSGKTTESLEIAKAAYSSLTEGRKIIYR